MIRSFEIDSRCHPECAPKPINCNPRRCPCRVDLSQAMPRSSSPRRGSSRNPLSLARYRQRRVDTRASSRDASRLIRSAPLCALSAPRGGIAQRRVRRSRATRTWWSQVGRGRGWGDRGIDGTASREIAERRRSVDRPVARLRCLVNWKIRCCAAAAPSVRARAITAGN
jgi:hypothetical protein